MSWVRQALKTGGVSDPQPALIYAPGKCPECGARNEQEAETLCRPTSDETGDWSCPGEHMDDDGNILVPTKESCDALDAWIEREIERQGWNVRTRKERELYT